MSEGGQQRAFANRIKLQSAQQIRQSATATVKAATEKSRPKLQIVDPLDYEGELISRRKDLEKEKFLNLLLFPQQDVSVSEEEQKQRTEVPPVPSETLTKKTGLLTQECLKLYSSNWHKVTYNYSRFGGTFSELLDSEYHQQLSPETFELDLVEEEKLHQIAICGSGTPLSRRGYLYKGTFPQDGGISVSMKNYRKRWFVLTGCPSEGGYILMFYKDEKSSNIKGKIELDTCTEIKANSRHKTYGFDILTEDEKVFYPLAADSEAELEEWTAILTRAIASEMDDTDGEGVNTLSSFYAKDTLIKDVKKLDIRPEMLEHSATIEAANAKAREKERVPLFNVYPELMQQQQQQQQASPSQSNTKSHAPVPEERLGYRFMVKCNRLDFKLTMERNGERGNIEPFFVTLALYDAGKGVKISEDFHVDLNSPYIRQMVPPPDGTTDDGPHPLSQKATRATEAVFSVTIPSPEIYLVAKVEKILQGGISACAEPYMRAGENPKAIQKLSQQVNAICSRLGQHRMPFAWAVRPVFNEKEELDTTSEFQGLFKQESQKLMDEDLLKLLADYKNIHKHKLQVIPSSLSIDVLPFKWLKRKNILTPSLVPVKAPPTTSSEGENGDAPVSSPRSSPPILEVQEFPPLEVYNTTSHYYPHLNLTHHLYVYPTALKYDNQKAFAKARNIACCVQFKDSDARDSKALPVIFSKTCSTTFIDRANTAVIHHCTTPTFYEEVKVKLPVELEPSHHLFFTFSHIACDVQKATKMKSSTKLPPVEAVVGYAWLPLMDSKGRVSSGTHNLAVSASLPSGYLGLSASSPQSGASSPEVRWVDNQKQLFTVTVKLNSTIYTEDPNLHKFFKQCRALHSSSSSQTPTMAELLSAIKVLENVGFSSLVRFLPLILAQLFKLLSHSNKDVDNIKPDVVRLLISLVGKVVAAEGTEILRSYIEYMFVTEVDSSKKKAVHDELARLLVQYLRQQNGSTKLKLLDHLWFFLEIMLKSMAQYLFLTKKIHSSRKSRYPEDFGWNLQSLITSLLSHIMDNHNDLSARKANRSLADFVKQAFSFMDRGVVFRIVARYLEAFSVKETSQLSSIKLEFLKIICDHEHFIALNLPFPISTENMDFVLSDDFCRKHFLVGILLREVECSLEYDAGSVRRKTLEILRNLIAKHDCDSRYADPAQKARIALLYFPLVPLVLTHVDRLNTGCTPYISPMLNATSMAYFSSSRGQSVEPPSLPGSAFSTLKSGMDKDRSLDRNRQQKNSTSHAEDQISLSEVSEFSSLFTTAPSSSPVPTLVEQQTMIELDQLTEQETRDLLISVLFVLKYIDRGVLQHWWRECMGSSNTSAHLWSSLNDTVSSQFSQLLDFFDLLESCLYTFRYVGKQNIAIKIATSGLRQADHPLLQPQQSLRTAPAPPTGKEKVGKKHSTSGSVILSSPSSSLIMARGKPSRSTVTSVTSSLTGPLSSLRGPMMSVTPDSAEVDLRTNVESALSKEVGFILLNLMDIFGTSFWRELGQEDGDNVLMSKFFSLFISFLQVCQSVSLQTHIFAMLRAFTFQFRDTLFRGSSDYCGILCYEVLQCCNSRLQSTRTEATVLLYLIMRGNFECFSGQRGFVRAHIQSTIAVSKLVTNLLGQNDTNLRKSLSTIATFVDHDEKVKGTSFPLEVQDLMKRLKTVLSSTAQMKIHQIDHEKLVDLHYTLANSYSTSPELRQTWLDSMASLHLKYGNYSEAAHCCIHIAGLIAEYLRIKGIYPDGCRAFRHISPNIERDESSIKDDRETTISDELTFTERNLVTLLESSITYLEQAERYEVMSEVYKLLQPFYEKTRDFEKMKEMYGKLHVAFKRVVEIMATGKRYLGTYFRIAFYGKPFGDDNEKQFIYKEPKVTKLAELTLRLQKLYSKKFGSPDIVHIITESGRVNPSTLNQEHAHIQITHVEPYFTTEELETRQTTFERQNRISRFVFETPFTVDGKAHGDVTKQCMRKTILTTSHWFPYVKKRILVLDQEQFELSAIEVAVEAMDKKTSDMSAVVKMDPPDLKGLQLLLQGSISTQVNQGVQEYSLFLKEPHVLSQPKQHIERLKEAYRSFIQVCQEAMELNSRLISTDQLLYHDELKSKFQQMQLSLAPLLDIEPEPQRPLSPTHPDGFSRGRRGTNQADPHRMSAILFSSISGSK